MTSNTAHSCLSYTSSSLSLPPFLSFFQSAFFPYSFLPSFPLTSSLTHFLLCQPLPLSISISLLPPLCLSAASHLISCTTWDVILAPDAPRGWPRAMAPPLMLRMSGLMSSSLWQAMVCGANASLI